MSLFATNEIEKQSVSLVESWEPLVDSLLSSRSSSPWYCLKHRKCSHRKNHPSPDLNHVQRPLLSSRSAWVLGASVYAWMPVSIHVNTRSIPALLLPITFGTRDTSRRIKYWTTGSKDVNANCKGLVGIKMKSFRSMSDFYTRLLLLLSWTYITCIS